MNSVSTETKNRLVGDNKKFAVDLYNQLRESNKGKNLFFSPFSISTALAMTYAGARGETEKQIASVLNFSKQEELHQAFREVIAELNGEKGRDYELAVANRLYGEQTFDFLEDFLDLVATCYDGGLEPVDFINNAEEARTTINTWVEEKTKDRIKDLIPEGALSPITRLVLVNAIYFKGNWANQFKEDLTDLKADFTRSDGSTVTAPLMCQHREYPYIQGSNYQLIELPYVNDELSMVVILPNDNSQMSEVEDDLSNILDTSVFGTAKVHTYLPRFKTTLGVSLTKVLQEMGMKDAFSNEADFSAMVPNPEDPGQHLNISDVIHKAFVEVNEEGTEAAAATAVVFARCCATTPAPDPVFRADHPFIFAIRDNATRSILFLGRIEDPTDEGK